MEGPIRGIEGAVDGTERNAARPVRVRRARRLLVLLPGQRLGGAEAHTLRLCRAASAAGMAVTVAAEAALHPALEAPGRRLLDRPVAWRRGLPERARAAQAAAVREALAAAPPDLVLLPLPWPDQAGGALEALAATGLPTLVVAHLAPHGEEPPAGLDEAAIRAAQALRADWVAVSAPTGARLAGFLGLPPGRVATLPNGVEPPPPAEPGPARAALRQALGLGPDAPVVLFLGRLDEAKGADRLPELAEAFARRTGGVIACAGTGSLEKRLRAAAPPGHPLRLLGRREDAPALLAAADALVLPSRLEGAPLAFLEAASHRLPVIATPEALEALGEEAPGLASLAPGDDLGALADALEAGVAPDAGLAARTEAAWRLAAAWDAEAMEAAYLGRMRRLLLAGPEARGA